jgi:transcription elongation factor Elf1
MINIDGAMAAAEFRFDEKSGHYISKMTPKLIAYLSADNSKLILEVAGHDELRREIKGLSGKKFKDTIIRRSRLLARRLQKAEKKLDRERRTAGHGVEVKVNEKFFTHERCTFCGKQVLLENITVDTRQIVARYICEDCERKIEKEKGK